MATMPKVDPRAPQSFYGRALRKIVISDAGTRVAMAVAPRVDPWLLKATGGRFATSLGLPILNLTTTGRKSGKPRTATLLYFTRDDDVVLVASSFGRDKHPAWYLNLKSDPHAQLLCRGREGRFVAREADEPDRTELYGLATELYGGYEKYAAKTDRKIPVMLLSPAPSDGD
jgi:deazaflavin-dependent oxidoreductase (nitroreductase family)